MKVGQVPGSGGVYNNQGVKKVESTRETQAKKDVVSISGSGQDYNTAMKAVNAVQDIRIEKVEELSAKVASGTYDVGGKEIIEKLAKNQIDYKA